MIKWKYKPSGNCPIQSEGWFRGNYFYFRARWDFASIEFCKTEEDWNNDKYLYTNYRLYETKMYKAGWLPKWICTLLIYKGCFLFLINKLWKK